MSPVSFFTDNAALFVDHPGVLATFAAMLVSGTWLAAKVFYQQQVTTANGHRDWVKAQLDDAQKRLQELEPLSQATDLSGLLDDLTRKFTATALAGEALTANSLVHLAQDADGRSVVLLADKLEQFEAHGFVTRSFAKGDEVRIERLGQFSLPFVPKERRLFLGVQGQVSEILDDIPNSISQQVGTLGPGNVCLFNPGAEIEIMG